MAITLEFLHASEDILDFINFLYDNNCVIRPRSGDCCDVQLDRTSAIASLSSDLFAAIGTYFIETTAEKELLALDSCGRFSMPRYLGKRGRMAGRIICENKHNEVAMTLFEEIKKHFRKNYHYQRYNGQARMSCYFAPHYLVQDQKYRSMPDPEEYCPGYLRIICVKESKESIENLLVQTMNLYPAITITTQNWYPFWPNSSHLEFRAELMYDPRLLSYDTFTLLVNQLAGGIKGIRFLNNRYSMSASVEWPLHALQQDFQRYRLYLAMDHLYLCSKKNEP
jgi:hypothetical protein